MDVLYSQILERNARETNPFVSIHEAHSTLLNQYDSLQIFCSELEREVVSKQQQLDEVGPSNGRSSVSASTALKNETRLRDKLEKLQEELNAKLEAQAEQQASALQTAKELSEMKDAHATQKTTILGLEKEHQRKDKAIDHLTTELVDAKSRTKLAEKQYVGLKESIRSLQDENDQLKKENRQLEERFVNEKTKLSDEMNALTELVESLKREVDMLRTLKGQEEKREEEQQQREEKQRKGWFGMVTGSTNDVSDSSNLPKTQQQSLEETGRKWGSMAVVVPSQPKQIIQAHAAEASCVRYDACGTDLVATGSSDSTVKVFEGSSGMLKATFRGGSGNSILCCDISNGIIVGAGTDKTCRVWNLRTDRMIHHLVGHVHKITCVRLFGGEHSVITGSADRSLKLWDISRKTYRQTTTFRHSSTAHCVDVSSDSSTAVSGHLDGGLRFWDIRTGDRTAEIANMHEGGITSVQFNPSNGTQLLTNGMDSCLKIVDIRTCTALHVLRDEAFQTSYAWASGCFSPDGSYVAVGSSASGLVFVWETQSGKLQRKLAGHETGVCGFAWGRGGTSGQQVASVDRDGTLVLWA